MAIAQRFIKLIISVVVVIIPTLTQAISVFSGPTPEVGLIHSTHIDAATLLHRQAEYQKLSILSLETYTPRSELQGEFWFKEDQLLFTKQFNVEPMATVEGVWFMTPWITAYFSVDTLREAPNAFGAKNIDNINLTIGRLLRFPFYIQMGWCKLPFGLHASEGVPTQLIYTKKTAFPYNSIDVNNQGDWLEILGAPGGLLGGTAGFNYTLMDSHTIQGAGFLFPLKGEKAIDPTKTFFLVGWAAQYHFHSAAIDFMIGGGSYQNSDGFETGNNLYVNTKLGAFRMKGEYSRAYKGSATHFEGSYHFSLYRRASAIIVGHTAGSEAHMPAKFFGLHKLELLPSISLVSGLEWNVTPTFDEQGALKNHWKDRLNFILRAKWVMF